MTTERRALLLAWSVPAAILLAAALWLLPLADASAAARALVDDEIGNWVVLAIWLPLAVALAVVSQAVRRSGRPLGPVWPVLQGILLVAGLLWSLPPLLVDAGPVEAVASAAVHFVLPVVVLPLSAVTGLVVFLRA
ncbi:hypothetical protein [Amnibacterium endophyticum]|uniref:Uncharacterized protein n=1 Tax=Amnibacterium endophyticum TaxID=2109337 RepID=A0ABW4LHG4_9MICO